MDVPLTNYLSEIPEAVRPQFLVKNAKRGGFVVVDAEDKGWAYTATAEAAYTYIDEVLKPKYGKRP